MILRYGFLAFDTVRFIQSPDGLHYKPSGNEPGIVLFSRQALPASNEDAASGWLEVVKTFGRVSHLEESGNELCRHIADAIVKRFMKMKARGL